MKTQSFRIVAALLLAPAANAADLFNNTNTATVSNQPTAATVFQSAAPAFVTDVTTYHWNDGHGLPAGAAITIGLEESNGTMHGPFAAQGLPGQNGVPNVNQVAVVNQNLPAGQYKVVDSDPATWSRNAGSGEQGFAIVRGSAGQGHGGAFQYAVKFVCGSPTRNAPVVAPGNYFTAINVHNPNERPARFHKKIAVALPGEKAGPISQFFEAQLKPDEAFEIDCPDILRHAEARGFLKGFVVLETELELDVVAVYSAGHPLVETMEIERVAPRSNAKVAAVKPPDPEHCPPNTRTSHDAVGNEGCCCNKPKTYPPGGPATWWPDCGPGLTCVGNLSGPGIGANTYSVCAPAATVGSTVNPPIDSSQPPFCAQR